jgi:hypothetical protein
MEPFAASVWDPMFFAHRQAGQPAYAQKTPQRRLRSVPPRFTGVFADRQAGMAGIKACRLCRPIGKNILLDLSLRPDAGPGCYSAKQRFHSP